MNAYRHSIASILLLIFCIIQCADLHILDHDADDTDCSICQFASEHHNDSLVSVQITDLNNPIVFPTNTSIWYAKETIATTTCQIKLRNKAPPIV